jgi:hypothetical protein
METLAATGDRSIWSGQATLQFVLVVRMMRSAAALLAEPAAFEPCSMGRQLWGWCSIEDYRFAAFGHRPAATGHNRVYRMRRTAMLGQSAAVVARSAYSYNSARSDSDQLPGPESNATEISGCLQRIAVGGSAGGYCGHGAVKDRANLPICCWKALLRVGRVDRDPHWLDVVRARVRSYERSGPNGRYALVGSASGGRLGRITHRSSECSGRILCWRMLGRKSGASDDVTQDEK